MSRVIRESNMGDARGDDGDEKEIATRHCIFAHCVHLWEEEGDYKLKVWLAFLVHGVSVQFPRRDLYNSTSPLAKVLVTPSKRK